MQMPWIEIRSLSVLSSEMPMTRIVTARALPGLLMAAVLAIGCSSQPPAPAKKILPVPVVEFAVSDQHVDRAVEMTGSVVPIRHEEIAFQVGGRITFSLEEGQEIRGPLLNSHGDVVEPGSVVARVDPVRYDIALQQAKAVLATSQAEAEQIKIQVEEELPFQLAQAESRLRLAETRRERTQRLSERRAAPADDLDAAQSEWETARAQVAQARGAIRVGNAQLDMVRQRVRQAEVQVRQAELDLKDTVLTAPFSGIVSSVLRVDGGLVNQGTPVVGITMIDPVKVEVMVPREMEQKLNLGDSIQVVIPSTGRRLEGFVGFHAPGADSATRTYRVAIFVRNHRLGEIDPVGETNTAAHGANQARGANQGLHEPVAARTPFLWTLEHPLASDNRWFLPTSALCEDTQGDFVYRVQNISSQIDDSPLVPTSGTFTVEKVRVRAGPRTVDLSGSRQFLMREIVDPGLLDPKRDVIAGDLPQSLQDGSSVLVDRSSWQLRPGDLVRVVLPGETSKGDLWLPREAVVERRGQFFVYSLEQTAEGKNVARQHWVRPAGQTREGHVRVQCVDGSIAIGDRLISEGAHLLTDGCEVVVVEETVVTQ